MTNKAAIFFILAVEFNCNFQWKWFIIIASFHDGCFRHVSMFFRADTFARNYALFGMELSETEEEESDDESENVGPL